VDDLVTLIRASERAVAFTGAGVSTLSGIPDFRGPDGIYRHADMERVFDLDVFLEEPGLFFACARDFIYGMDEAEPSLVHLACAQLERGGRLRGVVTQNIDMLHQRAGSRTVVELHGSPASHTCLGCRRTYDFAWAKARVRQGEIPRCEACGSVVKPDITFFGEMLPVGAYERACELAAGADLMLVLGSSLFVQPAASVPLVAVQHGARLAVVNSGPTPLDARADCRLDDLQAAFAAVQAALAAEGPGLPGPGGAV